MWPPPFSGSGRLCPHSGIVGHSYSAASPLATFTIRQTVIYLVIIYIFSTGIKPIESLSYSFEFISRSFSPASHSALLVLSIAGDRPAPPARLAWDHSPVFVVAWHRDIATQSDIATSRHSATMTSPWSQPRSPFRPASENEKMFQLTMDDVEANRTIIPSRKISM